MHDETQFIQLCSAVLLHIVIFYSPCKPQLLNLRHAMDNILTYGSFLGKLIHVDIILPV